MTTTNRTLDDWRGCYKRGWGKELVPAAYAHPAKVSFSLAERIYQHCADEKWLVEGDTVLDPFGGIGGFAYHALGRGLHFVGVELEPRFVALGNENIALWNKRYGGRFAKWGTARIVQGDSRRLLEVVREAEACVSSPPFGNQNDHERPLDNTRNKNGRHSISLPYGITNGNIGSLPANDSGLAAAISSPPFAGITASQDPNFLTPGEREKRIHSKSNLIGYGDAPGNLGNLPATDSGLAAAISSPPYAQSDQDYKGGWARFHAGHDPLHANDIQREAHYGETAGQLGAMAAGNFDASIASPPFIQTTGGTNVTSTTGPLSDPALIARHAAGNSAAEAYGADQANLGNMAEGEYAAAVSSPPYEKSLDDNHYGDGIDWNKAERTNTHGGRHQAPGQSLSSSYGIAPGNIGSAGSDDFWTAARAIVDQTHAALRPGGHAIWVVKDFVRNKQRVPFSSQWRQLCEAAGFVTLHEHRAWVVENNGTQLAHDGNHKAHVKSRKSFFRRLAEKKGSPEINWETVFCMVKIVKSV